ncbi:MAG: pilus assembly protein [Chloroflexi bacterium]|nr:pilus assembly protein [Chloroflexota bacterium]
MVLPVLLLMFLGVVDLGRGIYYYNSLSSLAREGARAGLVLQGSDWDVAGNKDGSYPNITSYVGTKTIVGRIASEAVIFDLTKTAVTIQTPMGTNRFQALPLTVSVQYPFELFYANWIGPLPTITLDAQSTMRIE